MSRPVRAPHGRWLCAATLAATIAAGSFAQAEVTTNRLIHSADPYLLLHAHNPVDWYPWGPEAFAKARAENKPIFLSIGYSTCYWCHIAEKEIYSDPAIAALMNKWFVNIKVDREERPDVDRLYIIATQMLTEHGAWPNNLFLTPDLKPFYAGSYFPPKDGPNGPGFPTVLAAIHDLWANHRADKIDPAANEVFVALSKIEQGQAKGAPVPVEPLVWLKQASQAMLRRVDPVNGGFGDPTSGQKFPQAPSLELLLSTSERGDAGAREALTAALDAMAYGGIHDQLAGGFHRYTTEPTWSVPHFEKMLYDNAQLLRVYAGAYALTKAPLDRAIALDIAAYLMRDMSEPGGGFATAQDAETGGIEGATTLWTRAQIEAVLGAAEAKRFLAAYALAPVPDETQAGVLRIRLPLGTSAPLAILDAFAADRAKLLTARAARVQPLRDDKIVIALNGLVIDAFARVSVDLDAPALLAPAEAAAARLWTGAYDAKTGLLKHQIFDGKAEGDGYLDDYAMLGDGFLSLAEAAKKPIWRQRGETLADALVARFLRPDGRLAAGAGVDALPVSLEDGEDSDVPSGASAALSLLTRLAARPEGQRFAAPAASIATHLSARIAKSPAAWPSAIVALVANPPSAASLAAATAAPVSVANAEVPRASVPGVPSTADHVHASAAFEPGPDGDTIAVTLRIDSGFHVNSHKPTLDYLVPTDVTFVGVGAKGVSYPPSMLFRSAFAPDGIAVYEGDVSFVATFAKGSLAGLKSLDGSIAAQACDKQTCLPPATLPIKVTMPGR